MATGTIISNSWKEIGTLAHHGDSLSVPNSFFELLFVTKSEPSNGNRALSTATIPKSYYDIIPIGSGVTNAVVVLFDGTTPIIYPKRTATNTITVHIESAANGKTCVVFYR